MKDTLKGTLRLERSWRHYLAGTDPSDVLYNLPTVEVVKEVKTTRTIVDDAASISLEEVEWLLLLPDSLGQFPLVMRHYRDPGNWITDDLPGDRKIVRVRYLDILRHELEDEEHAPGVLWLVKCIGNFDELKFDPEWRHQAVLAVLNDGGLLFLAGDRKLATVKAFCETCCPTNNPEHSTACAILCHATGRDIASRHATSATEVSRLQFEFHPYPAPYREAPSASTLGPLDPGPACLAQRQYRCVVHASNPVRLSTEGRHDTLPETSPTDQNREAKKMNPHILTEKGHSRPPSSSRSIPPRQPRLQQRSCSTISKKISGAVPAVITDDPTAIKEARKLGSLLLVGDSNATRQVVGEMKLESQEYIVALIRPQKRRRKDTDLEPEVDTIVLLGRDAGLRDFESFDLPAWFEGMPGFGNACHFTDSSRPITVAGVNLDPYCGSLEAWIRPEVPEAGEDAIGATILRIPAPGGRHILSLEYSGSSVCVWYGVLNFTLMSSGTYPAKEWCGRWHHILATYDTTSRTHADLKPSR